jgi:hypothetical protein
MRSRVHDFKDKLGTVEAKVKLVEDIATEEEARVVGLAAMTSTRSKWS